MAFSKLIRQVKRSNTPLLRLTFPSSLSIIPLSCLLINYSLSVLEGHLSGTGSFWPGLTAIINVEMVAIGL